MPAPPSSLIRLSSLVLGNAQTKLRELAIASTDQDTIDRLIRLRGDIEAQQRRIMRVNLRTIDADPAVRNNIDQLTSLAGEIAAAVQEMRSITSAIRSATKILAAAEQFLSLAAIV
jgi:hypothetical protein